MTRSPVRARSALILAAGLGFAGLATAARADLTPECNNGVAPRSTECGVLTAANGPNATAVGAGASAIGDGATAIGGNGVVQVEGATLNTAAYASGPRTTAVGAGSYTRGEQNTVVGHGAVTNPSRDVRGSTALGVGAYIDAGQGTAIGWDTRVMAEGATAVGAGARAAGEGSAALGYAAWSLGYASTAVGMSSNASHEYSTALGFAARTDRDRQVKLGGNGSSVTIGDIAASTAAQTGTLSLMTVDAGGTVGRDTTILAGINSAIADVQTVNTAQNARLTGLETTQASHGTRLTSIEAVNAQQTGQIAALQAQQTALFDLAQLNRRDLDKANEGIAMALAMESPAVPPGARFAVSGGIGHFQSKTAGAAAFTARVSDKASVSAGVGFGFDSGEVGARAGFQFAW